jgi:pyruvate carboxylase subunit B
MDALDKLDDVFQMLPKVRKDLGNIPLVTPTSQIVGVQTVNNVLFDTYEGEYANITQEVKDLCYGLYGKTTEPINAEVQKKALKDYPRGETPITARPGSILEPEMGEVKEKFKGLTQDIDDEVLCALYPITGKRFLKWKYGQEEVPADVKARTMAEVEKEAELIEKALSGELTASKNGNSQMTEMEVIVDGEKFNVAIPNGKAVARPKRKKKEVVEEVNEGALTAPIPGMIVEFKKNNGDTVKAGEIVVVLEAMKMMNNFEAKKDGVISGIKYESGDSVTKGDLLFMID